MALRKAACVRGHAMTPENRVKGTGRCKACATLRKTGHGTRANYNRGCHCEACREANRRYRGQVLAKRLRVAEYVPDVARTLPTAPLLALIALAGGVRPFAFTFAAQTGRSQEASERWLHRFTAKAEASIYDVDVVCVALGRHPYAIYGSAWDADLAEKEDACVA